MNRGFFVRKVIIFSFWMLGYTLFISPDCVAIQPGDLYDRFYGDDGSATLNIVQTHIDQLHSIYREEDVDWFKIVVSKSAAPFTIKVIHKGKSLDAVIRLLDKDFNQLIRQDDAANGIDETETLSQFLELGEYYVQIFHTADISSFQEGEMEYQIVITRDTADNIGIPTLPPMEEEVGPEGGSVPADSEEETEEETQPDSNRRGINSIRMDTSPSYYNKVRLIVPSGSLEEKTWIVLSDPGDMGAFPHWEVTKQWRIGDRKENATIVWIRMEVGNSLQFDPPLRLRLQMFDNTIMNGFPIDDIPDGRQVEDAEIWKWNGVEWTIFDSNPIVSGNTAETDRFDRIEYNADRGFAEAFFAVFPRIYSSVLNWSLY